MTGISWTPEQEAHLKQYAGRLPVRAISLRINRSVLSVQGKAFQMGISLAVLRERRYWTTGEEKRLVSLAKTLCKSELAIELNRSYRSLISKATKLGLKLIPDNRRRHIPWDRDERRLIAEAVKHGESIQELCIVLPNRSVDAVTIMYYKTRKEMTK